MTLTYEMAARLFEQGEFLQLVAAAGRDHTERLGLDVATRLVVADALALVGNGQEASRLAELDRESIIALSIRSRAESVLGLIKWRAGDISGAIQHGRAAVRLAHDSGEPQRIAWAHLYLFRVLIDNGPIEAVTTALGDVRRAVTRAGDPRAAAYLHNCVAILEGQTGRLSEAGRHLDLAESLLRLAPNLWLFTSVQINRGSVECMQCNFDRAASHFVIAQKIGRKRAYQRHVMAAERTLAYAQVLTGQFETARRTLENAQHNSDPHVFSRLASIDSAARLYLTLGELEKCDEALRVIEREVQLHPEIESVHSVRWSAITRARLLIKRQDPDEAWKWLTTAMEEARAAGDRPLEATALLTAAQLSSRNDRPLLIMK